MQHDPVPATSTSRLVDCYSELTTCVCSRECGGLYEVVSNVYDLFNNRASA